MSSKLESWTRLRSAPWIGKVDPKQNDSSCTFQVLADGYGDYVYDEYSVVISSMPSNLSAESYWLEFARDPNSAVDRSLFNVINVFKKRRNSPPAIGDIYDIDIMGPDNGSIVAVAVSPGFGATAGDSWFDIQTVECEKFGSQTAGSVPQALGWTGMMKGISETIRRRGGQPKENSFKVEKVKKSS